MRKRSNLHLRPDLDGDKATSEGENTREREGRKQQQEQRQSRKRSKRGDRNDEAAFFSSADLELPIHFDFTPRSILVSSSPRSPPPPSRSVPLSEGNKGESGAGRGTKWNMLGRGERSVRNKISSFVDACDFEHHPFTSSGGNFKRIGLRFVMGQQ